MRLGVLSRFAWSPSLILVLLVAACSAPPAAPSPSRSGPTERAPAEARQTTVLKRIVAAIKGDPASLNYTMNRGGAGGAPGTTEMDLLLNAGLVLEVGQEVRPQLAEQVPSIENGLWKVLPDGTMETTWNIRKGARWHDGTPFTAEDLVFTAEVATDKELGLVRYPAYDAVDRVEARDASTLLVRWKQPFIQADLLFTTVAAWPIPKHLLEPTYQEAKARLQALPYWTSAYVGTGPFKLRDWVSGSHATLQAFDEYVIGRPKIDEIEVRFIPDANTLIANLLAGEIELNLGRGISLEQALQARDQWRHGRLDTALGSWYGLYPQHLNPSPRVVADVRFRRALLHAMDRDQLLTAFMGGATMVAEVIINPSEREYRFIEKSIVRHEYDPRRAAQLIGGLGYTKGPDGTYRDAAGQRLGVELRTGAGDELQEKMVLSIVDYWQQAGVAAEPFIFPRQRRNDREFRQTRPGLEMVRQPSEINRFHGSGTPLPENDFTGHNRSRYQSAELDGLIDRYYLTIPWEQRMGVLAQVVHHLTDQLVALGVLYDAQPMLIGNRITTASAAAQTANAHEWDIRT